ncbi:MAG: SAM-dependent chlorinase/fluorinase [Anaerolineales bacterium]|nr:SAM-dependent chlorinase/fluorinase [Anaerolineales bacterium]MCS7247417.1 SAM-dependent chlorinase/fluorinase [Anaerolineales bacterium]MDW8161228.1 SAM-dependent chlorinase/fluorinase [Anaerolineales bacterium]MDW8446012.1 SAM-dependent chlorinase/fluorinase [Anaerolineales bacterium]
MAIITLTTDFGLRDSHVGAMKGVIWSIAPQAQVVDITHLITPQNIQEGAQILRRAAPYYPAGTIHVAVVDPGVGTARRPIAGRLGDHYVVGPDNGIFTALLEYHESLGNPVEFVHLTRSQYWRAQVSFVFHGRDIFAPVAAHLANGVSLEALGDPITDVVRLVFARPLPIPNGLRGEVTHIDHFGNIYTNVMRTDIGGRAVSEVRLAGCTISEFVNTFGERLPGTLVSLFGSSEHLLVCEVNGNAARRLGVKLGEPVDVILAQS